MHESGTCVPDMSTFLGSAQAETLIGPKLSAAGNWMVGRTRPAFKPQRGRLLDRLHLFAFAAAAYIATQPLSSPLLSDPRSFHPHNHSSLIGPSIYLAPASARSLASASPPPLQ